MSGVLSLRRRIYEPEAAGFRPGRDRLFHFIEQINKLLPVQCLGVDDLHLDALPMDMEKDQGGLGGKAF